MNLLNLWTRVSIAFSVNQTNKISEVHVFLQLALVVFVDKFLKIACFLKFLWLQ